MTIDKQKYLDVITKANFVQEQSAELDLATIAADPNNGFEATFDNIHNSIETIKTWANTKLLEAEQEEVMNSFLAEMKLVFDKYSAKLEVGSSTDGYGQDYGNGTANVGVKFTATLNGVVAIKEINKTIINGDDLV